MESLDRSSNIEVSEIRQDPLRSVDRPEGQTIHKRKKVGSYVLHLDNVLGKGSFAKVYFGEKIGPSKSHFAQPAENKYAIKEIPNQTLMEKLGPRGQEALNKEIEISSILNHKHIVRLYDTIKTDKNNYLIFEFCGGGDLKSYLTEKRRLSEPVAQRFMHQICSGLQYLYC